MNETPTIDILSLDEMKARIGKIRAYDGISFDPEKRMASEVIYFEERYNHIVKNCQKWELDHTRLLNKLYTLTTAYLYSKSNVMSTMITGASNFPVRAMEKKSRYAHNHMERLSSFVKNIEALTARYYRRLHPVSQDDKAQKWLDEIAQLENRQAMYKQYNKLIRKGDTVAAAKLLEEHPILKRKLYNNTVFEGWVMSNNLANIKRLKEQVETIKRTREVKKESGNFSFAGGHVEFDETEIRFNIFFDSKPDEETRTKIKRRGFKWSPTRKAWTRGAKTIYVSDVKKLLQ